MAVLRCDGCGTVVGNYWSYQDWEDAARLRGWYVGEDIVLCHECRGEAGRAPEKGEVGKDEGAM
jgi:hypothetical protein